MSKPNLSYYEKEADRKEVGNLLKNLNLYKLYKELDMKLVNKMPKEDCNVCDNVLNVPSNLKPQLVQLCHDVCNIMLNIDDTHLPCTESSCNNLCNHIKFWIYEHLMKITTDKNDVESFYKPLESIKKPGATKREICDVKLYMKHDDFKKFKNIYDFLYTSKDIVDKISQADDTDVKLYCKHIKEFVRYYNKIKGNCTPSNHCTYYSILYKFKSIFTYENQLDDIYNKCNYEQTTCPSGSMEEEIPCLKEIEYKPIFPIKIDDKNNVISIISNIAIFIIPIFGLLSIFYKFTPLGFWLRSRMRKKNNTHKNMSQGKYDILENTSRTEQLYPESKEYNLRYQ
ncbi:Plasmodium vivax Vir protein, putative [Plasmodium vivax]|uniref:Vir protein, putative n=1 Tax=Plasmodium vivax TaxID=5855 RepID=A0A1G4E2A0_PLAVI|nr:Plasmodium vivax Vir protein, putative [Plasmodium vivax]